MSDRAARYSSKKYSSGGKSDAPILVAYVGRTPKGKIRLRRVGIRFRGQKEELVAETPKDDPRFVFENDYKVRKSAHDLVAKSAKFGRFYDASTRVFYDKV
ncbi:MAG: hypothetical protein OK457_07360 [Thaumarchaeota archaeon]|nr:hypothetical protein [Nitrososphaerota archaeon]